MNWKVIICVLVLILFFFIGIFGFLTRPEPIPEHEVFLNGVVLTMDKRGSTAEAISIRDGIIEKVGSSEEILSIIDPDTLVTDLQGRTLMPGFIDAHGHFPASGQTVFSANLNSPPMGEIVNMAGLLDRLSQFAKQRPDGWLVGHGYDDTLIVEKRHPTRDDLDTISKDRPIAIIHVSGHLAVVNSAALQVLQIDDSTADPPGGIIARDLSSPGRRRPNGVLEETAARKVYDYTYDLSVLDAFRMTKQAADEYSRAGVTTASAGGMPISVAHLLAFLSRMNQFPQRVALFPLFEEIGKKLLSGNVTLDQYAAGRVEVPRVKIIADGSIQGFTGYLSEPYFVPFKGDKNYRGYPTVSREDLFRQVAGLFKRRVQVAIHCNGDASIDDGLDAIEAAMEEHSWPDARPLIIHAQMTRLDQITRMARLGVTPSFFSAHTYYWGDRHTSLFMGPERASNMSPAKWALNAGLRFSSHLDTPVTPMLPLQAVWSQVERKSIGGSVIGSAQRIDRLAALRAVTIDAAWQIFMDNEIGSIEPGKRADVIVLSGDPRTVPDVRELKVVHTMIDGATVFKLMTEKSNPNPNLQNSVW